MRPHSHMLEWLQQISNIVGNKVEYMKITGLLATKTLNIISNLNDSLAFYIYSKFCL